MKNLRKFYTTFSEMLSKTSAKTNLNGKFENKDTVISFAVFADKFNKEFVTFATTVVGPTRQ